MKRIQISAAAILAVFCLLLPSCGQSAPTWQEQYDLGVRYLSEGNYEEAIIAFNAAIEIDPKRAEAYIGLADAYELTGNVEQAIQLLEEALNLIDDKDAVQARLDQLWEESEFTQQDDTENSALPVKNGIVNFSGNEYMMQISLTYPDLPSEVYAQGSNHAHDAVFTASFSDGQTTFRVWTQVAAGEGNTQMVAVPNGDVCKQLLTIAVYDEEDPNDWWWNHLETPVTATRDDDTIVWTFTMPKQSFTVADIQYIGYHLYYTANPEADEINQQATFSVENGALTYLNEGIVEELGFLISDKDADQYYMG